jgi:Ca2+-binding RTX toxin-like protein
MVRFRWFSWTAKRSVAGRGAGAVLRARAGCARGGRRRRLSGVCGSAGVVALEVLEGRTLLTAGLQSLVTPLTVNLFGPDAALNGEYNPPVNFSDYLGGALLGRTAVTLDNPRDGVWDGDQFEIFGAEANQAALERFDFSGMADPIVLFDSLASEAGESGDTTGRINDAAQTPDGILYVGQSAGLLSITQPTTWLASNEPTGGVGGVGVAVSGGIFGVSSAGLFVGSDQQAIYGAHGNLPECLPGGMPADLAIDISRDSRHIAGSFLWIANEFGGYDVVNSFAFDFSVSGAEPTWRGVEVDAVGNVFYAGEYLDLNTFETAVGFWDEDGSFLGTVGLDFKDFAIVEGDVVAAVNGASDGLLVRVRDQSTLSIQSLIGTSAMFPSGPPNSGGLFAAEHALGLLLVDGGGAFVTVLDVAPILPTEFPEDLGAVLLGRTTVTLDDPRDGVWDGSRFEIIGSNSNQAALERFNTTGQSEPIVLFDSLNSAAGESGGTTGTLRGAAQTPDGLLYVGLSEGQFDTVQPTTWLVPNEPTGGVGPVGVAESGGYLAVSSAGLFVGSVQHAIYGTHGELPELLPGGGAADITADISHDGRHIAGSFLWIANRFGGYDVVGTSGFDFSVTGGTPTWVGVEVDDAGDVFYAGEYFDTNTFENAVGFWAGDGSFLGTIAGDFAGLAIVNRNVVATVNAATDGVLVRVRDFAMQTVESLIGTPAFFAGRGLFSTPDQFGLLLSDAGGNFVTIFAGGPVPADVNLPTAGSYEVLRSGADLVVREAGGAVLLRREAALVTRLTITGSIGDDIVTVLNSGTAVDTPMVFLGGSGNDLFDASLTTGSVSLIGNSGDDTLTGGSGDDVVSGDSGNNLLTGGAGTDTLWVLGSFHLQLAASTASGAGHDTFSQFEQAVLEGGLGNNRLDASSATIPVLLLGQGGNDTLLGGSANDVLNGGTGTDFAEITGTNIVLTNASAPGSNGDTLTSIEGLLLVAAGPDSVINAGAYTQGNVTIVGSSGNDTLTGGSGDDVIIAGAGDDVVTGGNGNDIIVGQGGHDSLSGEAGDDTILGGQGRDTIDGGQDSDDLFGGGGPDSVLGEDGDDTLIGGSGSDTLAGGGGADALLGGGGRDTLIGNAGADTLNGQAVNDSFNQQVGPDTLIGGDPPAPRPAPVNLIETSTPARPLFLPPPDDRKRPAGTSIPGEEDSSDEETEITTIDAAFAALLLVDLLVG